MEQNIEQLTKVIKQQAELFLLDAGEFYPFGGCINIQGEIKPIGAYTEGENDQPSPIALIELIEKSLKQGIENGEYQMGALAIDVVLKENDQAHDAVEVTFFNKDNSTEKKHFKYKIKEKHVEFN